MHKREGESCWRNCERKEGVQESEGGSESACGSSTADSANETALTVDTYYTGRLYLPNLYDTSASLQYCIGHS